LDTLVGPIEIGAIIMVELMEDDKNLQKELALNQALFFA
jgi:hypothetical protein